MGRMLDEVTVVEVHDYPRIIIYGPPGVGKTTLASEFPNPIFIQVENGATKDASIKSFGKITRYEQVEEALTELFYDEHNFKTLVIDSLDKLEVLITEYLCRQNKWKTLADLPYGNGFVHLTNEWIKLINKLDRLRNKRNIFVVGICHVAIDKFEDPSTNSYTQYNLNLNKRIKPIICAEFEMILFLKKDPGLEDDKFSKRQIAQGSNRFIHCEDRPSFHAKNRYGMPEKILYRIGNGYGEISKYITAVDDPIIEKEEELDEIIEPEIDIESPTDQVF